MRYYYFHTDYKGILLIIAVYMSIGAFFISPAETRQTGEAESESDVQRIIGRWIRSDGGYALELKYNEKDGKLAAAYYNPRPINVSRTAWHRDNETINVLIELSDINYPGSTYALRYDAKTDRLIGTYFQAMDKITYKIDFLRSQ